MVHMQTCMTRRTVLSVFDPQCPGLNPGVSSFAEVSRITRPMNGTERLLMSPTVHEGWSPPAIRRDMNNEILNSETRELTIGELDAVTGGAGVADSQ